MKKRAATTPKKRKRGRKLTAARARELFSYSKLTGIVRWRVRPCPRARVYPGERAGTVGWARRDYKRRQISFEGRIYKEHRLIWLIVTGEWPPRGRDPDHRNGDACDNRWSNLRPATKRQNQRNSKLNRRNRSGFKWVRTRIDYDRPRPYQAVVGGKILGDFATPERAHAVAAAYAAKKHGAFFNSGRRAGAGASL